MALEVLSIVVTPVTEVGKCLVRKLKTEFDYVTKYNSYLSNFREELLQLQKKRNDVDKDLEKARRESKEPREEVLGWVERVEELEKKYMKLTTNNRTNNKCLMGLRCSRRRKSKQLLKLTNDINNLQEKGSFTDIAHMPPSLGVVPMGPRGTVENIPSRELIKNEVMKALEDDNIRSIGVHGMGGIGKTTLVNSINNGLRETRKKVIMVTVSKDPDMKIIQSRIAERLDLKLDKEDMPTRANALLKRLRSEESVLIILDDVWKPMELSEIGLGQSTKDMPCKLIVTTRNANVCSGMEVEKVIKMNILPEDEAWTLFEAKAGNVVVEMPSLEPTAREIVRRCKGSPLAIATLGSTLRTKEVHSWAYALQVLKEPNAMGLDDIMDEVVKSLRLSYDQLKPNVQQCFLYCCLFPEDYNISLTDLRNYGTGEGFLKMTSSLKEAQNELLHYIEILKDCCLLLDGYDKSSVKMHDVVRDVAIWIASNDEDGFLVNVGGRSNYLPASDKLLTYKRISLMDNKDILFSNSLECPQLRSLLVRESRLEKNYSFEGVKSLRVLHLSWVSVPESISQLRNLRTLYLDGCELWDRTYLLGGLTKLEVLSMQYSMIGVLPVEFGNLINLKFLNLTGARIYFVAPNVFSRFLKMEELLIAGYIKGWGTTGELKDDDGGRWCIRDDGSRRFAELKEVLSLPRLSVLDIAVDRPLLDGEVLNNLNLQNFRISVDSEFNSFDYDVNKLCIGSTDLGKHWIRNLIAVSNKSMDLSLWYCGGFKSMTDLDPAGSFNHLQYLCLVQCNDVESVIVADRSAITAQDSFEKLETLELHSMDKMERILHGATSSTKFFGKLEVLLVDHCSKICTIFPSNLLFTENRLENLERVDVNCCDEVQHIFNTEDNEFGATPAATALLSGVTDIDLYSLPKLKSIWKGIMPEGSFQGLIRLSVDRCHSLKHLLPSDVAGFLQNLEKIEIRECDAMETIIFPTREEAEGTSLLPMCRLLTVDSCPKLKNIFSFGVVGHLLKLNKLSISYCHGLRQVFGNGDEPTVTEHRCLLPELNYLELVDLRGLTRFDQDNLPISGPLEEIKVFVCPNLTRLPLQTVSALKFVHAEDTWFRNLESEDESQASILKPFFQPYFQAIPVPDFWGIDEKLHSLLWKVAGLWLDDYDSQLEGTTQFRRLLSGIAWDITIGDVRKSGVVPCLVEFLTREDHTQLQFEAAWALRNIGSMSSASSKLVIDHGALPIFVKLLCSSNEFIRVQAIWALEKIARDSPEHQDLVLRHKPGLICQSIVLKNFGMVGADDPLCMLSLGNAKINLNYPPSSPIEITKERHVDQMLDEEPYVRDTTSNASVKIDDNSSQSSSTEQAKQSHITQTPEHELHLMETWRNFFMKLDLNSLPTSSMELAKESHISQMPEQENHKSDSKVWDSSENVVMGESTSTATTSAHDEVWNDQMNIQVHCFFKPCEGTVVMPKIDLNYPPSSPIEIAKECQVDQMLDEEPYVRDITRNSSMKIDDNSLQSSSTEQAKQSHITQTPEHELHLMETWRNFFMKLDLNSLPTSSMELAKESHVSQMPEQENHKSDSTVWDSSENVVMGESTSTATTSAHDEVWNDQRNIQVHCFFKPCEGIVVMPKIDLNYPPSSPIEIAKEYQVDQMPDEKPYVRDITRNSSVKIDDNSLQSSSTEQAKQSHITQTPEHELHLMESWRNFFMKLDLNSLPTSSMELEKESHVSQMPEQENHELDSTVWYNSENVVMGESISTATTSLMMPDEEPYIDDNSLQSSSTEQAKQSHITQTP